MTGWLGPRGRHGGVDEIPLPAGPGRLWLCGKHFIGPDPGAALAEIGATTVVCLTERHELADRYPAYVAWLGRTVEHPDRHPIWFPIPDLHAYDLARMDPLLDAVLARLAAGESVLAHCGAGIGRAGTLAVLVLVSLGLPLDEALTRVAASRPMAGPEVGAQRTLVEAHAARRR